MLVKQLWAFLEAGCFGARDISFTALVPFCAALPSALTCDARPTRGDRFATTRIFGFRLVRALLQGCGVVVDPEAWEVPAVFRSMQEWGGIPEDEMWRTFNMGVGMVVAVSTDRADALLEELVAAGEQVFPMGAVVEGEGVRLEPGFEVAG